MWAIIINLVPSHRIKLPSRGVWNTSDLTFRGTRSAPFSNARILPFCPRHCKGAVLLAHVYSQRPEGSWEGAPMNREVFRGPVYPHAFSPACALHSALLGVLGLLPSRIPILSTQAALPGLEAVKTGFIFGNALGLQAASQGPQGPDGLSQPTEGWPPAWCSPPTPVFRPPEHPQITCPLSGTLGRTGVHRGGAWNSRLVETRPATCMSRG